MKLSFKLLGFVALATVIITAIASTLAYYLMSSALQALLSENQMGIAKQTMEWIDGQLYEREMDLEQISGEMFFEDELKGLSENEDKDASERMKELSVITGPWDILVAVDLNAKIIASADNGEIGKSINQKPRTLMAFDKAKGGQIYHSDLVLSDDTGKPTIIYAAPIRDRVDPKHQVIGVLISNLAWPAIEEILGNMPIHESSYSVLINRDGKVIASSADRNMKSSGLDIKRKSIVQDVLAGHPRSSIVSKEESLIGVATLTSCVPQTGRLAYQPNGWGLILETPIEVALGTASKAAWQLVLFLIPVLFLMAAMIFFALFKYVLNPISLLTETTRAISAGDLSRKAPIISQDEIGQLAQSFNQMISNLNQTTVSKDYLETTLASIGDAVIVTDIHANVTFMNPIAQGLTGWCFDEAKNKNIEEVFPIVFATTGSKAENPVFRVIKEGVIHGLANHTMLVTKHGQEIPIDDSAAPIRGRFNQIIGVILVFRDVSERYRAEKVREQLEMQLRNAQKLESVGQLAAGIAHEINTPIQYVGDNTKFLETSFQNLIEISKQIKMLIESVKDDITAQDLAQKIAAAYEAADMSYIIEEIPIAIAQSLEGTKRVSEIVMAMKEFSHPGSQDMTAVDINRALLTTITVSKSEWKYAAEMETDFDQALPLGPA